ncbi:MAG: VanZ family protein [Bacteroidetes bacterium]|nr:VanZ family protein [Bacteroidota bacterium]MBL6962222.1 VanZ family protein [Bacteroidota bacterium]
MNKRLIPSAIWIVVITVLSLIPSSGIDKIWFEFIVEPDKIAHFILYAIFAFFVFYGKNWTNASILRNNKTWIFVVLGVFLYSIILELLQSTQWINRNASFSDIIANMLGFFVGILLFISLAKRIRILR